MAESKLRVNGGERQVDARPGSELRRIESDGPPLALANRPCRRLRRPSPRPSLPGPASMCGPCL